jgi:hypothetical protein
MDSLSQRLRAPARLQLHAAPGREDTAHALASAARATVVATRTMRAATAEFMRDP